MPELLEGRWVYVAGEFDSPLSSVTGGPVEIEEIRKKYNKDNLYEDPDFPAVFESIGYVGGDSAIARAGGSGGVEYKWLRPHEICKILGISKPDFAVAQEGGGADSLTSACSGADIKQGRIGNCWYLAALGSLAERQDQLKWVIPEDNLNGFDDDVYCGAFHFRFFSMATQKWIDIVVDDRLVCTKNDEGKWGLLFAKTSTNLKCATVAEFWTPLIEKAYSKFIGSFERIEGGCESQGLEDFTGGFSEIIPMCFDLDTHHSSASELLKAKSKYDVLKEKLTGFVSAGYFIGISTYDIRGANKAGCLDGYSGYDDKVLEDGTISHVKVGYTLDVDKQTIDKDTTGKTGLGLVGPHAYAVLNGVEVEKKDGSGTVYLLQVKNPHATHEWSGKYSDGDDASWDELVMDLRLGGDNKCLDEGIFWIELADVLKYYRNLELCVIDLNKNNMSITHVLGTWPASLQADKIDLPVPADSFGKFTGFSFEVQRTFMGLPIPIEYGSICPVAFTLVLKGYHSVLNPVPLFSFMIFKVSKDELRDESKNVGQLLQGKEVYARGGGSFAREISKWMFLEAGSYVVLPVIKTTSDMISKEFKDQDIHYALRVITESPIELKEISTK